LPVLTAAARQTFAAFPFVRFARLDIERPPAEQGFPLERHDLVLAANVLHATRDLRAALRHCRSLLAPGGMLLVLELTQAPRWVELVFGLTEGWRRFEDTDVRSSPLLGGNQWRAVLSDGGFGDIEVITDPARADGPGQVMVLARKPVGSRPVEPRADARARAAPGSWLVLADAGGVGKRLAQALEARGHRCALVFRDENLLADAEPERFLARILGRAGADRPAFDAVVHLWSFDALPAERLSLPALEDARRAGCSSVVRLVQVVKTRGGPTPGLWLVTGGVHAIEADETSAPAAASLWGLGRVLLDEHPELGLRMVDLPALPTDADVASLADELLADDGNEEVALREGRRFVHRLVRAPVGGGVAPTGRAGRDPFALGIAAPGVLDTLRFRPAPRRAPRPGEVEIEVHAAGLNFKDVMIAMGLLTRETLEPGYSGGRLGFECAGKIVAVGEGVDAFAPGDEVCGFAPAAFGSFAITRADLVVRKPARLTMEEAAAFPAAFVTAHYALDHLGRMAGGERLLVHAAAGGVGLAAVQLAQAAGAEVFATAGSEAKRDFLRSIGVRHLMDSRSVAFGAEIMRITDGQGVDLVLNSLAGEAVTKSLSVLRPGGRFLEIGKRDIQENRALALGHFARNLSFAAIDVDRLCRERPGLIRALLSDVAARLEDGTLRSLPSTVYDAGEIGAAFRLMAQARHIGKIVVTMRGREVTLGPPTEATPPVRSDGTYLITGGLGGFGLVVAEWLVRQDARFLVLMGRSAPSPEARQTLARLERGGATVMVAQGDVSREEDVVRVMADIAASMPPLRGVLHLAMALDDAFVLNLDEARLRAAMAPKVSGAWNLHVHTRDLVLDFFVLFSSISAWLGTAGQASYAAGNAFMEALAQYRRGLGLPALAVAWGRLASVGYVARHERVGRHLDHYGYRPLAPREATEALGWLLGQQAAQVGVLRVDWARWRATHPSLARSSRFRAVLDVAVEDAGAAPEAEGTRSSLRRILAAPADHRQPLLVALVAEHAARVLGEPAGGLDPDRRLTDCGLDSLMATELKTRLERALGVDLPVTMLLQGPTVTELAAALAAPAGLLEASPPALAPAEEAAREEGRRGVSRGESRVRPRAGIQYETVDEPQAPGEGPSVRVGGSTLWRLGRSVVAVALRLLVRLEVEGLEKLPRSGPVLLAGNHVNYLDALLLLSLVPRPVNCLVADVFRGKPLVGWFLSESLGAVYVARGEADAEALRLARAVLRQGGLLAIAPEGKRNRTGVLLPARTGVAYLASTEGAAVVPVAAYGHERFFFTLARLRRVPIRVRIGDPLAVPRCGLTARDLQTQTDRIMRAIGRMLPPEYRGPYREVAEEA
ncbi:MAG: SDR family NAD(P)-dependent oxidoreductase, partial [Candidatus Rokubacteria bacterium]|nr:SDR family NAD(P)-dependent oxidoreductase [Candidatus Rokubacteria bacterium]